jgi:predicted secreted protein
MRRIDFGVERETDVENDLARAVLAITVEGDEPAELADRVNRTMAWALERARAESAVRSQTGAYRTFPVSVEGKIRRWRVRQELHLESGDTPALTALIGALQERMELASISFRVSPERRREVEDELIREALEAYRARAALVVEALGAKGYELVHLHVGTSGGGPPPRPYAMESMAARADVSPPALEGGTSQVSVSVTATIELR